MALVWHSNTTTVYLVKFLVDRYENAPQSLRTEFLGADALCSDFTDSEVMPVVLFVGGIRERRSLLFNAIVRCL